MSAEYITTDINITAVLKSQGFKIVKITPSGRTSNKGSIKQFHFESSESLTDTKMKYIHGDLTGNLRDFTNAMESVRELIYGDDIS